MLADLPLRNADGSAPAPDAMVVRLLAETLIRLGDVTAWLRDHGWLDDKDQPRPALAVEDRLHRRALDYAESLGMTPRSRARLGLDVARTAVSAAQALYEPDPELRRALLRQAGIDLGEGG